ncbi:MAG: sodium-independent anion transporter, partial [Lachnospiraceae bacterium]|nr:sodium-independent anion transporter [Lachnospiraceae bacterium]
WKYVDEEDDPDSIALRQVPTHTLVYEISGPMFFAAADKILKISVREDTTCLILRMRSVNAIDATAMHSLEQLYEKYEQKNIQIILSHVNGQPKAVMEKSGFAAKVGEDNFCAHIDEALERAKQLSSNS